MSLDRVFILENISPHCKASFLCGQNISQYTVGGIPSFEERLKSYISKEKVKYQVISSVEEYQDIRLSLIGTSWQSIIISSDISWHEFKEWYDSEQQEYPKYAKRVGSEEDIPEAQWWSCYQKEPVVFWEVWQWVADLWKIFLGDGGVQGVPFLKQVSIISGYPIYCHTEDIKGQLIIDASEGEVWIGDQCQFQGYNYLKGPIHIGSRTHLKGAHIERSWIGHSCRIGGEIDQTVIGDYVNKAHSGYIGNSVIGSWVNIGAGTTVSNLKNTYSSIKEGWQGKDTKQVKCGAAIGAYSMIGVSTVIQAGSVLGAFLLEASHGILEKRIPPLVYQDKEGRKIIKKLEYMKVLRRMMKRREVLGGHQKEERKVLDQMAQLERQYGAMTREYCMK